VIFQKVQWKTPWTAAEERARIYRDWLESNPCDYALTTDLFDVEFYVDPFCIMRVKDDKSLLYVGSEPTRIGKSAWMKRRMLETYGEVTNESEYILNPGIVGGNYTRMITFLDQWLDEMTKVIVPTLPPHDICAFNRLLHRGTIPYFTGFPLHTIFRLNEPKESGAMIRHK
jgi:hypothetical protein